MSTATATEKLPKSLPVDPLIPWIQSKVNREAIEVIAARCGVSDKIIRGILNGNHAKLSFNTVDLLITKEGGHHISEFYPEYEEERFCTGEMEGIYKTQERAIEPKAYCRVEGCDGSIHGRGYCNRHYRQFRKGHLPA